jgi:ABC-2 type transport system ATP-binding protein
MTSKILEIFNLTKKYGDFVAVDGFNLSLEHGTVHGLVGPNGAGKSTMLSIISGLRRKTSGEINFGLPQQEIMLMPDTPEFFGFLTARQIVDLARSPFLESVPEANIQKVLSDVGLSDAIDKKVGGFSRGMKQRLGLATTIIGEPSLILLDEPCSALDPLGRHDVLEIVNKLKESATVLFSTHILSDVETVCDSVTVVDHGKTLYEGTVNGISSEDKSFEDSVIELLRPSGVL